MLASRISFIGGFIYSLATIYYGFVSYRLAIVYKELNISGPILQYWLILPLLLLSITSFFFWAFFKKKARSGKKVGYGLLISLLLLAPIIIYIILAVYSSITVWKLGKEGRYLFDTPKIKN